MIPSFKIPLCNSRILKCFDFLYKQWHVLMRRLMESMLKIWVDLRWHLFVFWAVIVFVVRPDDRTKHSRPSENTQDSHTQSHKQQTDKKPRPTQCRPHCSQAVTLVIHTWRWPVRPKHVVDWRKCFPIKDH
jgi:hypothetical protein